MSFSTYKQKIKTVGDLKKYLENIPDSVNIIIQDELEWCNPYFYFDAEYYDYGDGVKSKRDGKDIWISQVCIDNKDDV